MQTQQAGIMPKRRALHLLASVVGYLDSQINIALISFAHVAVGNIGSGAENSLNLPLPPSLPGLGTHLSARSLRA